MNSAYPSALAALARSAIGGLTPLNQHSQDRAKRLSGDKVRRQKLYKQFIDETSKLNADALEHEQAEVSGLVSVYALINRMRVLSRRDVVEKAEGEVRTTVKTYFAPNTKFPELRELLDSDVIDPLRTFSEMCRAELLKAPWARARHSRHTCWAQAQPAG
jgi:hypothetical protein